MLNVEQNNFFISICISSYNHACHCVKLVNEILELDDSRIEVVVCDDCSDDDTYAMLSQIEDIRLRLIRNEKNLGPCKNWYHTIDAGSGKYLLHVLDRDTLNILKLKKLIEFLEINDAIVAGYAGKSSMHKEEQNLVDKSLYQYSRGKEAIEAMGGIAIHPTGFFINRKIWKSLRTRKYFYEDKKYGIYPHSYVLALAAYKGDLIHYAVDFYRCRYSGETLKSRFYNRENKKQYYWEPENVIEVSNKFILEICKFIEDNQRDDFILCRFRTGLYRATVAYRNTMMNTQEMKHYGFCTRNISKNELFFVSVSFLLTFLHVIRKVGRSKAKLIKLIISEWFSSVKNIIHMR